MKRALIVGCGYVGSALGRMLAEDGWRVWGARRSDASLPADVEPVTADVSRPETLKRLPPDPHLVVYSVSADERTEDAYRSAYVEGLENLLEALSSGSGAPFRLLYLSSTAVYDHDDGRWVDEDTPVAPSGFRGRVLLDGEAVARDASGTVVRLGGIYGPGRTRLLERVRRGEAECPPERIYTNRIHRDDAAGILAHLAAVDDPRERYLGVDREPTSLCRVMRWMAEQLGAPEPPRAEPGQGGRRRSNKRCSSERIVASGYRFRYPGFREGYGALIDSLDTASA